MPDLNINLGVKGLNTAVADMGKLVTGAKQFRAVLGSMPPASGGRGARGGGGSGGGSGGGGTRTPGGSGGPAQRAMDAHNRLRQAIQKGNQTEIFDATIANMKAQDAFKKAQDAIMGRKPGSDFGSRLTNFISSARVGLGPGGVQFMPLVGRLLALFGASGPVGVAVTAGAAALSAFVIAVHEAARALTEIRNAALLSGGNTSDMATLQAMGLKPEQIPGMASSVRSSIMSDPLAGAAATDLGVDNNALIPGKLGGATDDAAILAQIIKGLAAIKDPQKRYQRALQLEHTELLPLVEDYARHTKAIEADAKAMKGVNNEQATKDAGDFSFNLDRIGRQFQTMGTELFGQKLKDWSDGLEGVSNALNGGVKWLGKFGKQIGDFVVGAIPLWGPLLTLLGAFGQFSKHKDPKPNDPLAANTAATQANTAATKANTDAQNKGVFQPGIYGGGPFARTALPPAVRGNELNTAVAGNSLKWGAFAL